MKSEKPIRLNQINLVCAIMNEVANQCGKDAALIPRHLNAIIAAATSIVLELEKSYTPATPNCGLQAWLDSDDTGLSSKFMAQVLVHGRRLGDNCYHPHDPSDFGRCLKFLAAVPEARAKLNLMAAYSKEWRELVTNWTELEALFNEELPTGTAPKLYARMKVLGL